MEAVRFVGVNRPAQLEDVRRPSPGPGQVVIRIGGGGVCHSDLHVMEEDLGYKPPPILTPAPSSLPSTLADLAHWQA